MVTVWGQEQIKARAPRNVTQTPSPGDAAAGIFA